MREAEKTLRQHIRRILDGAEITSTLAPDEVEEVVNDVLALFQEYGRAGTGLKEKVWVRGSTKALEGLRSKRVLRSGSGRFGNSR